MRRPIVWLPVSIALLGFVVWRSRPWELANLVDALDLRLLLGAVALNAPLIALWAARSASLMRAVGSPLSIPALVPVVAFANTINNLTPASSGEIMRAVILRDRYAVPYRRSAAVILIERLWAIALMILSAGAAAVVVFLRPGDLVAIIVVLVALSGAFVPFLAYRVGVRPARLLRRAAGRGRLSRVLHALSDVDDEISRAIRTPASALFFVATTTGVFACYAAQLVLVLAALGSPLGIVTAWAALGLGTIAGVLSALPFGLGAGDAVLVLLLAATGVDGAVAAAATLLLRLVATLPTGVAGTIGWVWLSGGRATVPEGDLDDLVERPPT